jgi:hypothetical protein
MAQPVNGESQLSLVLLGILRSLAGFPVEHSLELIKISAQARPEYSYRQIITEIVQDKGIFGFTNTSSINFSRRILKEVVRWPIISLTHKQLINRFPQTFTKEGTNSKVATGVFVALFNTLVIVPLDQLMVFRIAERERYFKFIERRFSQDGISSFYKGGVLDFSRQLMIWTTVMGVNSESKKKFDLFDKDKAHPYLRQGFASVLIAIGITAGLPVDFAKTRIQMDTKLQKMKIHSAIQALYRQYGIRGFYAGAKPIFIHSVFHATLSGYILDQIFDSH